MERSDRSSAKNWPRVDGDSTSATRLGHPWLSGGFLRALSATMENAKLTTSPANASDDATLGRPKFMIPLPQVESTPMS
eukprot:2522172-Pyramimonas_sp.AAC.1